LEEMPLYGKLDDPVRPGAQAKAGHYVTIMFNNKWQKQYNT
jgi:hypothetical protein